jgi:hypothetical protein
MNKETCSTCGQRLKVNTNLPLASLTPLMFYGKMLYKIEGYPGLFTLEWTENCGEGIFVMRIPGKSTGGCCTLYRAVEAMKIIQDAMETRGLR